MSTQVNGFWWRWLIAVTSFTALFGLSFVVFPNAVQGIVNSYYIPDVTLSDGASDYVSLLYGIAGAVMVGWMGLFFYVLWIPFRKGERSAWIILTVSLVEWYILDSAVSLYTGFAINVGLNTVFLILFAIPLAATYRSFFAAPRQEQPIAAH